jgi:hypothetical protein
LKMCFFGEGRTLSVCWHIPYVYCLDCTSIRTAVAVVLKLDTGLPKSFTWCVWLDRSHCIYVYHLPTLQHVSYVYPYIRFTRQGNTFEAIYLYMWTISPRVYNPHSSKCFGTDMDYKIYFFIEIYSSSII